MTPLLAALLAAAPLTVRVLEREHPASVELRGKTLRCGEAALQSPATVAPGKHALEAGGRECAVVTGEGDVSVRVGALTRRYRGLVRVTLEGSTLRLIDEVDVEDYLPAVVYAEASGAPPAALQVQAVVSRTFALASRRRHEKAGYDLCDLTHCQVYRGLEDEHAEPKAAVDSTRGQVLLVGGLALKPAFFHAACGGHTSRALDVFGADGAGPGVSDVTDGRPACQGAPDFEWRWEVDRVALAKGLELKPDSPPFELLRRDAGGRVVELRSFGRRFSGAEFASRVGRAFGWQALPSLRVAVEVVDDTVRFTGSGAGHGVGLCQRGAWAMAAKGADARSILQRYFPDCQVRVP